jgi:ribonuclease HI
MPRICLEGGFDVQQALFEATDIHTATVYTDGGCDPNPGPGGWAAIVHCKDREIVLSGNAPHATNNQMEIEAAIAALGYLAGRYGRCHADLYTDSRYLRQGITEWIDGWFARGWKTKNGQAVKNQPLWQRLAELTHAHKVQWHWVKGHAGNPLNERVDRLAVQARDRLERAVDRTSGRTDPSPALTDPAPIELSIGISCLGSNGPGGWAVVIRDGDRREMVKGHEAQITSNALYLTAATHGLSALRPERLVAVVATSDYLIQGASKWAPAWQRRGWKTKRGDPVKNRALWEGLLQAAQPHQVSWQVSKGVPTDDLSEARRVAEQEVLLESTSGTMRQSRESA